ncbi:MAG: hypothetical protein ACLGHP_08355, partial [Vicinamibacteria bacterium]
MTAIAALSVACVLTALAAVSAQPAPLRSLTDLRAATANAATLPLAVRTRATVVRVDALRNLVFVDDGAAGMVVMPPDLQGVMPGAVVEIEGQLLVGGRGPTVAASDIEVVGAAPAPAPLPLVWADLRAGTLDARLVQVRAVVRAVEPRGEAVRLRLMTEGGLLDADLTGTVGGDVAVDAVVQATGVLVPPEGEPESGRRQLLGMAADIRVVSPPVADADVPALTVAALPREPARGTLTRRIRLTGVVTRQRPGRSVYLRDDTGAVYVETVQATPLAVGDRVEVVGYAAVDDFAPFVEDATYRRLGEGPLPEPRRATLGELVSGALDAELVETEGVLVAVDRGREEHTLVLQSGDLLFNAHVLIARADGLVDVAQDVHRVERVRGVRRPPRRGDVPLHQQPH